MGMSMSTLKAEPDEHDKAQRNARQAILSSARQDLEDRFTAQTLYFA